MATVGALPSVGIGLLAGLAYSIILGIYRLFFHPLAKFPGPKLAALTYWYECYFDVILPGQYIFHIKRLHQQYGPVLRVNPNEVHIADPEFFAEIYHQKSHKTDRDPWYNLQMLEQMVLFTVDHDLHAQRRQSLAGHFSARSVRAFQSRISNVVDVLVQRLKEARENGTVINLSCMYFAMAMDIVTECSLGKSLSTKLLSEVEPGREWYEFSTKDQIRNPLARHFKWVFKLVLSLPDRWLSKLFSAQAKAIAFNDDLTRKITIAQREKDVDEDGTEKEAEANIIRDLVHNSNLSPQDRELARIRWEANVVIGAGSQTVSDTLARTSFFILNDAIVLSKLRAELIAAIPDPNHSFSIDALANLPYLNAIIEEGLRLSFATLTRMPRVFHDHALQYKTWTIPPGVAVSQSTYITATDENIFPDPFHFDPDRWVGENAPKKYQTAFSKGRRMCIGINLAYAELRLALATVFRRFDLELYETKRSDAEVVRDYFIGLAPADSKGIRVKVVREVGPELP